MRKAIVLFLFLLSLAMHVFAAEKPLGVEELTSVEELAVSLSSYFPKVSGEVKGVQGDRLTLSLSKRDGLIPGMMLTLWREGREILHPVTKAVIGRAEDEVGTLEVVSVSDRSAAAVVKKKLKDPKQGDKARITPRKINVALVPLRADNPELIRALAERLNEYGRFNVLDAGKVDAFLKNSNAKDTAVVRELGTAFGLDAVVSVGVYPTEGRLMVTARIFYTEDASQLDTLVAMLDLKTNNTLGEIKPFFTPVQEEKTATAELPFLAQYFTTGDFEGDGKPEYAFSDGNRLHIYRNEPSGWREVWTETANKDAGTTMEWRGSTSMPESDSKMQHINIDSSDSNGNGKQEIFVTAMQKGKVFSYVVEFTDGSYRRIADVPGFLRVVTYPGKGTMLLGQAYDPESFYAGKPKQFVWTDGKYVPGAEIPLPKGLGIYGLTFAQVGERQPLLVALDDEDHLLVYSGETLLWKSAEQYDIIANYVNKPLTGIEAVLSKSASSDKTQRVRLRGRVLTADLNGDGKDEIILPKNITSAFVGGYTGAELHGLSWTGARLDPVWSIKDIPGPVFDFRLMQPDQSGARVNALVRTKGGLFTKDRQQVMIYSIR